MAYDLLFRRQIPVDVSRHPAPGSPTVNAPTMSLISVGAAYLFVFAVRSLVKPPAPRKSPALEHYAEFYEPHLRRTQEVPIVPMNEMMLRPYRD